METRGRNKDLAKTLKIHELYESGMGTKEIADYMKCSQPMVQYRLRQKLNINEILNNKRKSLSVCFWTAPEEIRIKVAELLNFQYIPTKDTQNNKESLVKMYQQFAKPAKEEVQEDDSNSLIKRVESLLDGKIPPYEIEDYFSRDDIELLNTCPRYVAFYGKIAWGVNTNITKEQVLEELHNKGIK